MKKIVFGVSLLTAFFCTNAISGITVINKAIPFNNLPSEIKTEIESHYVDGCKEVSEDPEMPRKNPKITFDKGFIVNVDFNADGLKDYIIKSSEVTCEGAVSMFTGSSDGFLDIYFQNQDGQYEHVLNYWLGREGLELKKMKDGYRFISEYNESYLAWDIKKNKFLSYYGPEKRLDVLEIGDEDASTTQTSSQSSAILKSVLTPK